MPADSLPTPLAGIRVLDLSAVVSGPLCTQILGDLGADVVKVETPRGDSMRIAGWPIRGGVTPLFAQVNRNKRGIVLDLKVPAAQEAARRLARDADVLVENWRPGVAERLGLGYEQLAAENPRLIYVAVSGFGPESPYRELPAYDMVIQALTGASWIQGGDRPALVRSLIADKTSAMTATWATLAAIIARDRGDGRGQRVDVPMLDAFASFMLPDLLGRETLLPPEPSPPPFDMANLYRSWETADGFVAIIVLEDHQFEALCRTLDREDLLGDERCNNILARILNAETLFAALGDELRQWKTADLVERARRFGAPLAAINDVAGFLADRHVCESGTVFEAEHAVAGRMRLIRHPARFGRSATPVRRLPPQLGEHTEEVLREAGYDDPGIAALRAAGALG
jgi:crotonobetainyl-CoA:carnitine CoA-transferase CaiB-like acyl-CoA transferase